MTTDRALVPMYLTTIFEIHCGREERGEYLSRQYAFEYLNLVLIACLFYLYLTSTQGFEYIRANC